jgi:chromosome segregation ATPase
MGFLEKENFDLKMRVYYLEENMRTGDGAGSEVDGGIRRRGGRDHHHHHAGSGDVDMDSNLKVSELHLELEEKNAELEQRNLLLTKSKDAIQKMKQELESMRKDADPRNREELLERIAKLKAANDEMEKTRHEQVNDLEASVAETKSLIFHKEQEVAMLSTRVEQLELDVAHKEDRLTEARDQHDRDQQHILLVNSKCEKMDEELVQARAHVELYRLETEDHRKEAEKLMQQLREAEDMTHHQQELHDLRHNLEQAHATHTERMHGDHKIAMQELRDEIDKLHEQHKVDLHNQTEKHEVHGHDIQQRHQLECTRIREELTNQKEEVRLEREREREDATQRMEERLDECRKLHSQIENLRAKHDHLIKEIEAAKIAEEAAKIELSFRSDENSNMKSELATLHEELRSHKRAHEQAAILKEELRRETNEKESFVLRMEAEKVEMQHKLDHATEMYDKIRISVSENEYKRTAAEAELKSIKATHSTVEEISRENEKYQHENTALSADLQTEKHRVSDMKRDVEDREKTIFETNHKNDLLRSEITHLEREVAAVSKTRDELNDILAADRAKLGSLDGLIDDLKATGEKAAADHTRREEYLLKELEGVRGQILDAEKSKMLMETKYNGMKREYSTSCIAAAESMGHWDSALTELLDGLSTFAPEGSMAGGTAIHFLGQSGVAGQSNFHSSGNDRMSMSHLGGTATTGMSGDSDELHLTLLPQMDRLGERIRLKIERFSRIRSLFVSGYEKEVKKVTVHFDSIVQKNALLVARVGKCEADAERVRNTIRRDEEIRVQRERDMERFRTETMSSHAAALREAETRYHTQGLQLSQAKEAQVAAQRAKELEMTRREEENAAWKAKMAALVAGDEEQLLAAITAEQAAQKALKEEHESEVEELHARIDENAKEISIRQEQERDLEETVRLLKAQVEGLQQDLEQYAEAEQVVIDLSARCEEVARDRDGLAQQLQEEGMRNQAALHEAGRIEEELRDEIERAAAEARNVHDEKMAMLSEYSKEIEGQQKMVAGLENSILNKEAKIDALLVEIEKLKARQITPELKQMIRDTKAIMSATQADAQDVVSEARGVRELVTGLHDFVEDSSHGGGSSTFARVVNMPPPAPAAASKIVESPVSASRQQQNDDQVDTSYNPQDSSFMSPFARNVRFRESGTNQFSSAHSSSIGGNGGGGNSDALDMSSMVVPRRVVPSVSGTNVFKDTVVASNGSSSVSRSASRRPGPFSTSSSEQGGGGGNSSMVLGSQMMSSYSNSGSRVVVQDNARSPVHQQPHQHQQQSLSPYHAPRQQEQQMSPYHAQQQQQPVMHPYVPSYSGGGMVGTPLGTMLHTQQQQQQQQPSRSSSTYAPGDRSSMAPTADGLGLRFSTGMSRTGTSGSPSGGLKSTSSSSFSGGGGANGRVDTAPAPGTASRQSVSRLQRLGGDIKALASKLDNMSTPVSSQR